MGDEIGDYRVRESAEQLCRYGGQPCNEKFYAVLNSLADLNDDICHLRAFRLCTEKANEAKAMIDGIVLDYSRDAKTE
jgi:hypothetical protein